MKTITLKNRIIVIVTLFTVVTISIFLSIQLAHEVKTVDKAIKHKARIVAVNIEERLNEVLNSSASETKLESLNQSLKTLEKVLDKEAPEADKIETLKKGLSIVSGELTAKLPIAERIGFLGKGLLILKNTKSIQGAYVLGQDGKIVFSTDKWLDGAKGDYDDLAVIKKLKTGALVDAETVVNRSLKTFSVYIPLKEGDNPHFAARIFFSLGDIWVAVRQVYQPAISVGVLLILINIFLGIFLARLVVKPVLVFNDAAKTIASGRLDLRVEISTHDELEELAGTFNHMAKELIRMKEKAENANPLTKLPGNIVIMEEVEKRIKEGKKFTVIYCDLDNFKAFNDKYGIHKGDEAIMLTGDIFKAAVKTKGIEGDFVGHEGGDDFLLVTEPERAQAIADYITLTFDQKVRALYNQEDLGLGHIIAHARDGSIKEFPIMTISLAGVTNSHRTINSYAEVTNIAAEVKKKAKKDPTSCFVLDQRKA